MRSLPFYMLCLCILSFVHLQAQIKLQTISTQSILMVKTLPLIKSAINRARILIQNIASAIHSLLPSHQSKNIPHLPSKKRKLITKKDIRLMVRRKLQARLSGNTSVQSTQIDESSSDMPSSSLVSQNSSIPESINRKFAAYLASNQEELICSVCRSVMLLPTATGCDHVFCLECIENSLVVSNRCPLCRSAVAAQDSYGIHSLRPIEKLIQMRKNRDEETEEHCKRMQEHESWCKNRFVEDDQLIAGYKVDIWKTDAREWKRGEIILVEEEALLVSYQNLPREQNEIIELPTLRIARLGFYSSRYQADEFSFPDLHFRNSVRIGSEFEFSILPFRRTLHQRIDSFPNRLPLPLLRRPVTLPLALGLPRLPAQLPESPIPQEQEQRSSPQDEQVEELQRLEVLSPEEFRMPAQNTEDVSQLLPNLNPEFRRQAESSSEEHQQQQQELFPLIEPDF